jgi:hypothetical protein
MWSGRCNVADHPHSVPPIQALAQYIFFESRVCGKLYKHTPPKNAGGVGLLAYFGTKRRITCIMLTYECNEINDLA